MSANQTIVELLFDSARRCPERIALVYGEGRMTYAELAESSCRWRDAICAVDVERQSRVAIFMEKRFEMVAAFFGAIAAGMIVVPINPQLKPRQVDHILRDCEASILITTQARQRSLSGTYATTSCLIIRADQPVELSMGGMKREETVRVIDQDPVAILYTSGSTGLPKGIVLSHRNVVAGAQSVNAYLDHSADDVILSVLPLSFDAGLSQLTMAVAVGARLVLVNYFTAAEVARLAAKEGATSLTAVPPLWRQLIAVSWPESGRRTLRLFANTGGHMTRDLLDKLRVQFPNARPFLMYGLTEAFRSTFLDPTEVDRRPGSIGKAIPNAEIHVLRPDGTPAAADESGELVHRGACVTLGYWNRPDLTAQRFRPFPRALSAIPISDIAVWSGDLVRRDKDGFLYFITRPEDMIKTSGNRLSPTEVEEVVLESGFVEEAVVFGAPHPMLDQGVVLLAVASGDATVDAIHRHCRGALPNYAVPHLIELCESLPRNANGKLDRASLKLQYRDVFLLKQVEPTREAIQEKALT
jgi:acyl-CoA ligase (AMP-forming) (exosortase A-associated)